MSQEGKMIIWAMLAVFVISTIISMAVFESLNIKVAELEVMKLDGDDWTEVCYETKTINRSKIIYPVKDGCYRFCDDMYKCDISEYSSMYCGYIYNDNTESCIECRNATEPYIYTWQETSCADMILIKEGYGDIISDTYGH